ncbi:hypothetical protein RD792_008835 [Penstemon davidsonii]|uniref:S-acyltransferase n=1 Tax=Penstemon davidsonii TaxID=160366 RepID=A0ABR0DA83_9LAMI|nr:hypothetical protein RD792_008835 [Penstemon davidsonii]
MNSVGPPEFQGGAVEGATEVVRTYQAWKGSNIFCLGGRFIFGPDVRSVFLSIFLIVAPAVVFCVFVARKLMDDFSGDWGISIMVVFVVFTLYVLVLLLLTSGRDPGIIPRNAHPPEPESYEGSSMEFGPTQTPRLPRVKDIVINGITVKVKYCETCKLYRPPRCSHCSICDNCVEKFDHHCPWVGQCIGQTTYENFRYQYSRRANPYNKGMVDNFIEVFFSSIPSSKNNFRAKVQKVSEVPSRELRASFGCPKMGSKKRDYNDIWDDAVEQVIATVSSRRSLADSVDTTEIGNSNRAP